MEIEAYDPEKMAFGAYLLLPERFRKEFLTSWHFLQATPFWGSLVVEFIEDGQALRVSMFLDLIHLSPPLLRDPELASSYLVTVYDHLVTFTRNLARVQWPGQRIYVGGTTNFPIRPVLFLSALEVRLLAEPASRARARKIVQQRMYQACVQFYLKRNKLNELPESCERAVNSHVPQSSLEAMERVPEFAELKKYLVKQGYISGAYYPLKGIASIERAIDRWFNTPSSCPVCGAEIKKKRKGKTTCGDLKCRLKKTRVKRYIQKILNREALSREQIISKVQEHEEEELKVGKKYKDYRKIKDVPLLVDLILSELPPPVEEL